MTVTLRVDVPKGAFSGYFFARERELAAAAKNAMAAVGKDALVAGKAEIARSGLGAKWQKAWILKVYPQNKASLKTAAFLAQKIPYSEIFEKGGTIRGNPMLWLPFSSTPRFSGQYRLTPRRFVQEVGPLFTAPFKTKGGLPILAAKMAVTSAGDKTVSLNKLKQGAGRNPVPLIKTGQSSKNRRRLARLARGGALAGPSFTIRLQPLYFGIRSVNIRKKYGLTETTRRAAVNFSARFDQAFSALKD